MNMKVFDYIRNSFGTGSPFTKENAIILTALTLQISIISTLIFSEIHFAYITLSLTITDLVGAYFLKKRFSLKKDTNFDYFKRIQGQEFEISNLRKEIEALKAKNAEKPS